MSQQIILLTPLNCLQIGYWCALNHWGSGPVLFWCSPMNWHRTGPCRPGYPFINRYVVLNVFLPLNSNTKHCIIEIEDNKDILWFSTALQWFLWIMLGDENDRRWTLVSATVHGCWLRLQGQKAIQLSREKKWSRTCCNVMSVMQAWELMGGGRSYSLKRALLACLWSYI